MKNTIKLIGMLLILTNTAKMTLAAQGSAPAYPIDLGIKNDNFVYSNTKNSSDYSSNAFIYELKTAVIFYKFTIGCQMEVEISHCGSILANTYIRLLKSENITDYLALSTEFGHCSQRGQAYLKIRLDPGTYYIASQGGTSGVNGVITTTIQGLRTIIPTLEEIDLGTNNSSFFHSSTFNTTNSISEWNYRPTNDIFYKFTTTRTMKLRVWNSMKSTYGSCITILNSTRKSSLANKSFPNENPNNEYLQLDNLPAGTYYVVSEGGMENGNITTWIECTDQLEFNLGEKSESFEYTHTQNTNQWYSGNTTGIFYRIDAKVNMDLDISNSAIFSSGTTVSLLNSTKSSTIASKSFAQNNPMDDFLEIKNLSPGVYYINSRGNNMEGIISTKIKGNVAIEYDLGMQQSSFDYSHTEDTRNSMNSWDHEQTNDVAYIISTGHTMDLRISNSMSSDSGSSISLLDKSNASIIGMKSFSKDNLANDYLEIKNLQPGTYKIISEGISENGSITTYINIINGDINRNKNYIKSKIYLDENADNSLDVIEYYDGLGRSIQKIQKEFSANKKDLVTYTEYDLFGREAKLWASVPIEDNKGNFVPLEKVITNSNNIYSDNYAYSQPVYEQSPLNRILEQYESGKEWYTNQKAIRTGYLTNKYKTGTSWSISDSLMCAFYKSTDDTKSINISRVDNYTAGELYLTRKINEDGDISYEFKNKRGQIILTRQIGMGKLYDTNYIYDIYGNLKAVLPPESSDRLLSSSNWTEDNIDLRQYAYMYKYDSNNRCIAKKLPGCEWVYYIYDNADHLIFTQDGEQRTRSEWSFTIPDVFGRETLTGICKNTFDYAANPLESVVIKATWAQTTNMYKGYTITGITLKDPSILSAKYYDNYEFAGLNAIPNNSDTQYNAESEYGTLYTGSYIGLQTGTLIAQLPLNGTEPTYLYSVMYYDYRGRVIQTKGNNPLNGGTEKEYIAYNFTGQPLQKKHIHAATGKTTQTELYTYAYDDALRLKTTQYSLNGGTMVMLVSNTYDELGRLLTTQHNGQSSLKTTYAYNVRSWLKSSSSPLFNQTLYYNDTYAGSTARYNGNISAMSWKMSNESPTRGYKFAYDNLSRLTAANYLENGSTNDHFNTAYAYDKQGNMTSLSRRGNTGTATYGNIDVLTMTYAGNQLVKAEDSGTSVSLSSSMDFKNNSNVAKEYGYDANGNLTQDLNKGISGITYNLLNLPQTLTISNSLGSATNSYTYAADGRKLKTVIGSKTTDYCNNMIYENGVLKRILVDGGYIEGGAYYFYLTDHLGNNRVVADASGNIKQTNHYYPFGMSFAEGTVTSSQPYKYNGKELDTDRGLNLYDYSARYMDPALGRFNTVDSKAEKYPWLSPYIYVDNNPLKFIDPNGKEKVIVLNPKDPKDALLIAGANNYKNDEGVFHIWAHGRPNAILAYDENSRRDKYIYTGKEFNTFMNENSEEWRSRDKDAQTVVILHSCDTGKETSGDMLPIAGKISKVLGNVIVIAPTEKVIVDNNTQKEIGTYSTKTIRDGRGTKTVKDKEGTWSEYSNGQKTDSYPGSKLPDGSMTQSFMDRIRDYMLNLFKQ